MGGKKKIAIACQGRCGQTAFTAGALAHLLREGVHQAFERRRNLRPIA